MTGGQGHRESGRRALPDPSPFPREIPPMITCRNHPDRGAYVKSRGLCRTCYTRAHEAGTITPIVQCCLWCCEPFTGRAHRRYCSRACRDKARGPRASTRRQPCTVDGCERVAVGRRLCEHHRNLARVHQTT